MMFMRTRFSRTLFLLLAVFLLASTASAVLAQDEKPAAADKKADQPNLETQLYIIIGTSQDTGDEKLPAVLEPAVKELRASLPFSHYRLAGTLINRVKTEGRLDLRWIGGPLVEKAATTARNPSFSSFYVRQVRLAADAQGRSIVFMDGFKYDSRVPIETYQAVAANGTAPPTISYESTGLTTDISMREGEPVIVGTLNVGPSGDAIILIVSARRALK